MCMARWRVSNAVSFSGCEMRTGPGVLPARGALDIPRGSNPAAGAIVEGDGYGC